MLRIADLSVRERVLASGVLLPAFIGAGWFILAGERQMGHAAEFVARATSVRIVVQKPGTPERTIDIQCPDRARVQAATSPSMTFVVVGHRAVMSQGGGWRDVPAGLVDIPPVCSGSPWANGRPDFAAALRSATEPGQQVDDALFDITLPSGETCRAWRIHAHEEIGPDTSDQPRVCLAEDDAHPVLVRFPDGRSWWFSRWNQRVDIELPAVAAPASLPQPGRPGTL